jgi:hypothetical protein
MKLAFGARKGSPEAPRVIGVSMKDRSAIMSAGRGADAAYWFDTKVGSFVSSTYYMKALPAWAQAFNERRPADALAGQVWTALAAPAPVLKTLSKVPGSTLYEDVYGSPFGNQMLLDFTTMVMSEERLGRRGVTDLLAVSFSSNDPVGHTYGPNSAQVRDITIRTDQIIGQLLDRVDHLVGLQHTIVALTSDHGVSPLPQTLAEQSLPGGRMTNTALFGPIQRALSARFGPGQWLMATAGTSPYLNYDLINYRQLDAAEVRQVAAEAVMAVPHVARVYTRDQLIRGDVPNDLVGSRVLRGFYAARSGDLEVVLEPYWIRSATGTTHGSPYNYDAHIPLILMGRRITPGTYAGHVALNDLAPTLATLIDVDAPSGSSGRVLSEAIAVAGRR